MIQIAVIGTQMLAKCRSTGVRRRIEKGEVHAQRRTCQCQHAAQLAATDYTDLHGKTSGVAWVWIVQDAVCLFSAKFLQRCVELRVLCAEDAR